MKTCYNVQASHETAEICMTKNEKKHNMINNGKYIFQTLNQSCMIGKHSSIMAIIKYSLREIRYKKTSG